MSKIFTPLGASNHTTEKREENDFYATDPAAIDRLFEVEEFSRHIWEPAAGMGHLSKRMIELGYDVRSTDLIDRGYADCAPCNDFLKKVSIWPGDIITNPPYKFAQEFVEKALSLIEDGSKVAMFLKITFLESRKRKKFFKQFPPKTIYVYSSRARIAKNGDFEKTDNSGGNAVAFAWFVWVKGYTGDMVVKLIN